MGRREPLPCSAPEEANFPAIAFDICPDCTAMERNFSQAVSCIPARMASTRTLVLAWCAFNVCLHSPTRCYSHVHLEVGSKQERAQGTWRDLWGTSVYCELSGQGGGGGTHQRRGDPRKREAQKCALSI